MTILAQLQTDLAVLRDSAVRVLAAIDVLLGTDIPAEPPAPEPAPRKRRRPRPRAKSARSVILRVYQECATTYTVDEMLAAMVRAGWRTESATATQYLQMQLNRLVKTGHLAKTATSEGGRAVLRYAVADSGKARTDE